MGSATHRVPHERWLNGKHFRSNILLNYKEHSSLTTSFTKSFRERDLQGGMLEQERCEVVSSPGNPLVGDIKVGD
ncbi:hypothetical protein PAMA_013242 [Pampus argenteus]